MRTDLKPLEIVQPEGPSFRVDGNRVRVAALVVPGRLRPVRGARAPHGRATDGRRPRPPGAAPRARSPRWSSPTATRRRCTAGRTRSTPASGDSAGWPTRSSSAATASASSTTSTPSSRPSRAIRTPSSNAICMHEEDYGILWKHHDMHGGTNEVRRSRRLVVSFIATVGNYEYGFYWYLYLDGNIQLEVKLTGIVSPMAVAPGEEPEFANVIAPGLAAPHHQHLFSRAPRPRRRRPDEHRRTRSRPSRCRPGPDNPWGERVPPEGDAPRDRARRATRHRTRRRAASGRSSTRRAAQPARPTGRLQARPDDVDADDARRPRTRASAGGPASPATTSGSRPTPPTSAAPRATTRTSTRAATASPAGPRPIGRSPTPTSCSGTRSASRTSCAPRTGR